MVVRGRDVCVGLLGEGLDGREEGELAGRRGDRGEDTQYMLQYH